MKIGVLGKISKVKTQKTIDDFVGFLRSLGYETQLFTTPQEIQGVELVIVLGGDGAILHSAVLAAQNGVKIVGINYGNLGFLTEYEKDEREKIAELLSQIEKGTCRILKRTVLEVEIAGKCFYALNEVALQRDSSLSAVKSPQILRVQVHSKEGSDVISGDGLLLCTPTGSTAYSLSAGGAILTPEVPVVMLTPVCAFSMRTRPIVFSDTEEFALRIMRGKAILSTDGLSLCALPENATVFVRKAPFTADFPVRDNSDFFAKVRNKLNE